VSLSDRLSLGPEPKVNGAPCSVGVLLRALPAEESAALRQMLDDPAWSGADIHDAVTGEGYDVGRQTVNRHRRRECRCAKESR
jgi:hypothetical protein